VPFYKNLRDLRKVDKKRTIAGLGRLRAQLDAQMPFKTRHATLILGTWNIRNFDDNRFGNGGREPEDLQYLAEIIARFDVLAVQEICDDLGSLERLMELLGPEYGYILTDVTAGKSGNDERLGFIFDRNKVRFQGIAGELVLPDDMLIIDGEKKLQFSRTPFMCAFQSGWFKFEFSTVHIYYGASSGAKYRRRVAEIQKIARFIAKQAKADSRSRVLVGDFNIERRGSDGFNALAEAGFEVVQNNIGSNKDQTKHYDQISYLAREDRLVRSPGPRNQGVLQFFESIFREADFPAYRARLRATIRDKIAKIEADLVADEEWQATRPSKTRAKSIADKQASIAKWSTCLTDDAELKRYYLDDWRTFRASDHLPLWVELEIDFSDAYLARVLAE